MTPRQLAVHPEAPDRKPRGDEIEIYDLAHRQNRNDNQDQFLVSQLRKQMVVTLSSLADADQLLAGSQRVALLMMVADGVGRHQRRGGECAKVASWPASVLPGQRWGFAAGSV
jgi:serine/threonine protein phosphatase PrpC